MPFSSIEVKDVITGLLTMILGVICAVFFNLDLVDNLCHD